MPIIYLKLVKPGDKEDLWSVYYQRGLFSINKWSHL